MSKIPVNLYVDLSEVGTPNSKSNLPTDFKRILSSRILRLHKILNDTDANVVFEFDSHTNILNMEFCSQFGYISASIDEGDFDYENKCLRS